jgi:hypothetical protein
MNNNIQLSNGLAQLKLSEIYLFRLILLFPITTLLGNYVGATNQIMVIVSIILFIVIYFQRSIKMSCLYFLLLVILNHVYSLSNTSLNQVLNKNTLFYFAFIALFYIMLNNNPEILITYLKYDSKYAKVIILIWSILILASLPFRSSYESGYFVSFSGDGFRLGPTCLFILSLVAFLYIHSSQKKYLVYTVLPIACLLMSFSRTYFFIGLLLFMMIWFLVIKKISRFVISIIAMTPIFLLFLFKSNIWEKFLDTTTQRSYQDTLGTFTNGRSVFWLKLWDAYTQTDFFSKLFGNGFDFVYSIQRIWAHNDFLQILLTFGILGLILYLYLIRRIINTYIAKKKVPFIIVSGIILIWFFNATFNMFYTYFCSVLSYPILLAAIYYHYNKDNKL